MLFDNEFLIKMNSQIDDFMKNVTRLPYLHSFENINLNQKFTTVLFNEVGLKTAKKYRVFKKIIFLWEAFKQKRLTVNDI